MEARASESSSHIPAPVRRERMTARGPRAPTFPACQLHLNRRRSPSSPSSSCWVAPSVCSALVRPPAPRNSNSRPSVVKPSRLIARRKRERPGRESENALPGPPVSETRSPSWSAGYRACRPRMPDPIGPTRGHRTVPAARHSAFRRRMRASIPTLAEYESSRRYPAPALERSCCRPPRTPTPIPRCAPIWTSPRKAMSNRSPVSDRQPRAASWPTATRWDHFVRLKTCIASRGSARPHFRSWLRSSRFRARVFTGGESSNLAIRESALAGARAASVFLTGPRQVASFTFRSTAWTSRSRGRELRRPLCRIPSVYGRTGRLKRTPW